MRSSGRRVLALLSAVVVLFALCPAALEAKPPSPPKPDLQVETAGDRALTRIEPSLRATTVAGGAELVGVSVRALEGVALTQYMVESLTRPFVDDGEQTTYGRVKASSLLKLASVPGVNAVQPLVFAPTAAPPPSPDGHKRAKPSLDTLRQRMEQLKAVDVPWSASGEGGGKPLPTGWFDVLDSHKSAAAWAKGYLGEGVLVAVIDDSVDFAHPDLMGTQATVKDETSPYYGWPMAFNPYSMLEFAYDQYLGYNYVADGSTWYMDSKETPPVVRSYQDERDGIARLSYAPLAGDRGERSYAHEYVLLDTSQSGVYHIGSHPDDALLEVFGERVAVLVVDEMSPGVYDTVYVDLDNDYDFRDEKPTTKESPISYRDMDGDGYADISGGMVYFIADGVNPIPVADWLWGLGEAGNGEQDFGEPDSGSLVAFHGALDGADWDHGTLCASNVVGQGVINGGAPDYKPPYAGPGTGMVLGAAPKAEMVGISNVYYDFDNSILDAYTFSVYGYDGLLLSGDEMQITSNSYGNSDIDNDGWDYNSRYVTFRQRRYSQTTSFVFSTGNGAPGYGTTTPPAPPTGIAVGASTQMGSTGWDSIASVEQITYNDVQSWSNRGPTARATVGVHVVAEGAYGAGASPLNVSGFDGWNAWETWGGTSRSAPVAMGNLALIYEAYRRREGSWPTYDVARQILMSGATNIHNDVFTQGGGSVNADRATDLAGGRHGVFVAPDHWTAGGFRGIDYEGFASIVHPGDSTSQTFTIHNPSRHDITVMLSDDALIKRGELAFDFTTSDTSQEDEFEGREDPPQYIVRNITPDIAEGTDLLVARMRYDYASFDVDGDYEVDNNWWLLVYDWTDLNGDGDWWKDLDGNGVLNYGEMDPGEFVRFTHNGNDNTVKEVRVQQPLQRMHDGILVGLIHDAKTEEVPTSELSFKLEFYQHSDWDMLSLSSSRVTVPARGSATVDATVSVPADQAIGLYEGAIVVNDPGHIFRYYLPKVTGGGTASAEVVAANGPHALQVTNAHQTVVPVVVNVAAAFDGLLELGGEAADTPELLYNNGVVGGHFTWNWREESGDWRFFFFDVEAEPVPGTRLIARDVWLDDAPPSDIDTLILGPASDRFTDPDHPDNERSDWSDTEYYGPYTLETLGGSPKTHISDGKWRFDTATDGDEEWVTAPLQEGLHLIAEHNVLFSGQKYAVPFEKTVATVSVQPVEVDLTTTSDTGSTAITFTTGIELDGLAAEAFGLGKPQVMTDQLVSQDDPDDPATASFTHFFTVTHASSLAVMTTGAPGQDLDLFLYYDANEDGSFDYPSEVIASSTTPTDVEFVSVRLPADGRYMAGVQGWQVSPSPTTFTFVVGVIEGYDLTLTGLPSGAVPADTPVVLELSFDKPMEPDEVWQGEIMLGPSVAPSALMVPVTIRRQAP
jgi:hypothetical protein